ncbi:MAG: Hsp20/alpha crystallin family protein [Planctomycetota bacterium]
MTVHGDRGSESERGRAAVEGILGGLSDVLGKFIDLAEKVDAAQQRFGAGNDPARQPRFHVGFNVRTMADDRGQQTIRVEPFGDVKRDPRSGEACVSECREPPADIFEEPDHVLVVVEMPGISMDDASFQLDGDVLTISAERESKRYGKEILLPAPFPADAMSLTDLNGVFEIRLSKSATREPDIG